MESANRAVPRRAFYFALQGAVQYIVSFLAYVALTRILNPSEIGELPLLSATYSVFSTITLFALGTGGWRRIRYGSCVGTSFVARNDAHRIATSGVCTHAPRTKVTVDDYEAARPALPNSGRTNARSGRKTLLAHAINPK